MPNPRVEALLSAVERGSRTHIKRLLYDWPRDPTDSKRALTILLHHLETEGRFLGAVTSGQRTPEDAHRAISLAISCLSGFDGALAHLKHASDDHAEQMFSILLPRIDDLIAWLYFFGRASPFIMPEHGSSFGASVASATIVTLFQVGEKYLEEDPGCLRSIVDLTLWAWMQENPPGRSDTSGWHKGDYELRLQALAACQSSVPARHILLEGLRSADRRFHTRLATTFSRRCSEWAVAHKAQYEEDPIKVDSHLFSLMINIARYLTNIEPFARVLRKTGFPTLAVKVALEFHSCPTSFFQDLEPSKRGTLAAEVTSRFIDLWLLNANEALHLVPDILNVGLLQTVLNDLVTFSRGAKPLHLWDDPEEQKPTPLQWIARDITFHPKLVQSLLTAIDATSSATPAAVFDDLVVSEHWDKFLGSIEVHRAALRKYENKTFSLCDYLEHHTRGSSLAIEGECKKCARCQTAVYCSPSCQQKDWETLHKHECGTAYHRRVELEREGGWLSHQSRMFNLLVLETLLSEAVEPQLPVTLGSEHQTAEKPVVVFLADLTTVPRQISNETAGDIIRREFYGVAAFSCARSRAMLEIFRQDGDDIKIACSLTGMGQFMVATMATFIVRPRGLALLNGFVRVLDEPRGKAYQDSWGSDEE